MTSISGADFLDDIISGQQSLQNLAQQIPQYFKGTDGKMHPAGSFKGMDNKYHPKGSFYGRDGNYHPQASFLGNDRKYHLEGSFLGKDNAWHIKGSKLGRDDQLAGLLIGFAKGQPWRFPFLAVACSRPDEGDAE